VNPLSSLTPEVQRERVLEFLYEVSTPSLPKNIRCHQFTLHHQSERGIEPLWTMNLCDKQEGLDRIGDERRREQCEKIADKFIATAEDVTAQFPRRQSFTIAAYTTNAQGPEVRPAHQKLFGLEPTREAVEGLTDSEEPSEKMALGQMMKWCEASMRFLHEGIRDARQDMQQTASRMERLLSLSTDRTTFLEDAFLKQTLAHQDSLDKRSERDMNAYAKKIETDREERMWRGIEVAIAKMVDMKLGTGPLSEFVRKHREQIALLAKGMDEPERRQLAEVLALHCPELLEAERAAPAPALSDGTAATAAAAPGGEKG